MLEKIDYPQSLKELNSGELLELCGELRSLLVDKITATGGHMGSNLAVIELTVALHYVFNAPTDKIVFDISHQTYAHKILTGRKQAFTNPDKYFTISGYTNPSESEYDLFRIGHTSTSLSLAHGLILARDFNNDNYNVVSVIGDGALSGGEALEGLNNLSILKSNAIVVLNDNEMSISTNVGGIYKNLAELRSTNGASANNMFTALGFNYVYVEEGNNVLALIDALKKVKDSNLPTLVHIHTTKGLGCKWAEEDKEAGHYASKPSSYNLETYKTITRDYLIEKSKKDKSLIIINAATPHVVGFDKVARKELNGAFIDVGIAEEHAVAVASGAARGGAKPVMCVLSSFLQRTFDQLMQDLALNKTPAVILVYAGGLSGSDETHVGSFDVVLTSAVPNVLCLSPSSKKEYLSVLEWAIEQTETPVIIRVPDEETKEYGIEFNRENPKAYKRVKVGEKVALFALGTMLETALKASEILAKNKVNATIVSANCYSDLDKERLDKIAKDHDVIITLENGVINGGFGEKIARYLGKYGVKTLCRGGDKEFTDRESVPSQLKRYRLTPELVAEDALNALKDKK